ncbi:NAD-dependent epimerase/dehydratase [Deinococcus proteolyticus MRP]|uniref:NAD-dependent epimerase/dehydratase n=1 Tax=Deinococcus proteolyticus (strain ATCC 35074 / DSM 20540 / JCM 6276 / NBRC 101906 / NCIMB 13154 / VKM Ac-1939 / CCM 2703 / MRP) TaxID=693977 RepID=F0RLB7_DEIPM|nr:MULTISPECIES: NAD-dependent epimerase/dehydratase family protein [Deinococcus]ADY25821.1 NAD-dependent epimerase/dehydratase [Deinococcus proteolyticus MRP]MCY1701944.1 NAD-dependent epimerase/dehydratase family protein [Deinococcus sp. SL84]
MLLVTGAAGHLGNVLIRHLLERGYTDIRAMVLPGEDRTPLAGLNVDIAEADITRPEMLPAAFEGVTRVMHLASLVSIGDAAEDLIQRVNVEGTRNIIEASKAAKVERLLYVGSIHAFARPDGPLLNEQVPLAPQTSAPYERTKSAATRLVLDAASELDTVVAAPSGVFGPFDFKRSEVGTGIRQWMERPSTVMLPGGYDFVDVRDVAEGLRLVLEQGRRGQVYLLGNEWIEMAEMARQVMHQTHGRAKVTLIPLFMAHSLAKVALWDSKRRGVRPVLTPYTLETLMAPYRLDWSKARTELGFTVRPISQTAEDTVKWWQENWEAGGGRR